MTKYIDILDGSGLPARPIQEDVFAQLETPDSRIYGVNGPPGIGKSFIARTIQRAEGASILTVNNVLVDQYVDSYSLNAVKGLDHYESIGEYRLAHKTALEKDSVFNPLSFYYWNLKMDTPLPSTIVIDEAHGLGDLLLLTAHTSFSLRYYGIPEGLDSLSFLHWLDQKLGKFTPAAIAKSKRLSSSFDRLSLARDLLRHDIERLTIRYEDKEDPKTKRVSRYLSICPIELPVGLVDQVLGANTKLILLSGSLTPFHIKELFPLEKSINYVNYEPLAPIENRPIYFTPVTPRKCVKTIARKIDELWASKGYPNAVVHVSYAMAKELAPYLPKAITHTKDTKTRALERFKKKGGLLLACGMAEGVDLPGDLCRLIIIPLLLYPSLGDEGVKKRMALKSGQEWYSVNTIMTTVQQVGRGVRSATDSCETYILDSTLPRLVSQTKEYLTDGFYNSIKWSK